MINFKQTIINFWACSFNWCLEGNDGNLKLTIIIDFVFVARAQTLYWNDHAPIFSLIHAKKKGPIWIEDNL